MNKEQIFEIIRCGENSRVQFKEHFTTQKQMAEELVAMANAKGGMIIVGCKDKTGEIVGLSYDEIQTASRELGNTAQEHVKPTIYLQTETIPVGEDRSILVAYIDEGVNKPYKNLSGDIYVKQGADKRRVTENAEILRLFHQSGTYYPDHEKVRGTSVADVNRSLVEEYCTKNFGKPVDEMGVTYERLLENLHILTPDGECTLAGLLFFGLAPQQFMPSMMIKAVAFYGNDMGEQSKSVVELMEATGYESRTSFRRKILTPLLEAGLLKPVLGDKNSPKQRYILGDTALMID